MDTIVVKEGSKLGIWSHHSQGSIEADQNYGERRTEQLAKRP